MSNDPCKTCKCSCDDCPYIIVDEDVDMTVLEEDADKVDSEKLEQIIIAWYEC